MEYNNCTGRAEAAKERKGALARELAYALGMIACMFVGVLLLRIGLWVFFPTVIETPLPPFVYEAEAFLKQLDLGIRAKEIVDMIAVK